VSKLSRRRVLKGMLNGSAVTIALPFLDCFLNENGTALASGAPLPMRFGTWSWGLGMSEAIFVPQKTGANYDLPPEIASLKPIQEHINLYTNFHVFKDAAPNLCHQSGSHGKDFVITGRLALRFTAVAVAQSFGWPNVQCATVGIGEYRPLELGGLDMKFRRHRNADIFFDQS